MMKWLGGVPVGGLASLGLGEGKLAVVEPVFQVRVDLDHVVEALDDLRFDVLNLALNFGSIGHISLGLDVQF